MNLESCQGLLNIKGMLEVADDMINQVRILNSCEPDKANQLSVDNYNNILTKVVKAI